MTDLTNIYLKDCSPFISTLNYDIDKRTIVLECVNNPDEGIPQIRVIFSGIRSYLEETINDEYDDQCMDSVIGMHWIDTNIFCLHTEKKEIIIEIENKPETEAITE